MSVDPTRRAALTASPPDCSPTPMEMAARDALNLWGGAGHLPECPSPQQFRVALQRFQHEHGLYPSGELDRATREELFNPVRHLEEEAPAFDLAPASQPPRDPQDDFDCELQWPNPSVSMEHRTLELRGSFVECRNPSTGEHRNFGRLDVSVSGIGIRAEGTLAEASRDGVRVVVGRASVQNGLFYREGGWDYATGAELVAAGASGSVRVGASSVEVGVSVGRGASSSIGIANGQARGSVSVEGFEAAVRPSTPSR